MAKMAVCGDIMRSERAKADEEREFGQLAVGTLKDHGLGQQKDQGGT